MATYSSMLAWRNPQTEELMGYSPWGGKEIGLKDAHIIIKTLAVSLIIFLEYSSIPRPKSLRMSILKYKIKSSCLQWTESPQFKPKGFGITL